LAKSFPVFLHQRTLLSSVVMSQTGHERKSRLYRPYRATPLPAYDLVTLENSPSRVAATEKPFSHGVAGIDASGEKPGGAGDRIEIAHVGGGGTDAESSGADAGDNAVTS
jgi:hypothetical protein